MGRLKAWGLQGDNVPSLEHTTKTAVAALLSLVIARTLQLPEVYWAAITTLIVMQSTLAATVANAGQQMVGTALGALAGALLVQYVGPNVPVFVAGVFILGLACAGLHLELGVAHRLVLAGVGLHLRSVHGHVPQGRQPASCASREHLVKRAVAGRVRLDQAKFIDRPEVSAFPADQHPEKVVASCTCVAMRRELYTPLQYAYNSTFTIMAGWYGGAPRNSSS